MTRLSVFSSILGALAFVLAGCATVPTRPMTPAIYILPAPASIPAAPDVAFGVVPQGNPTPLTRGQSAPESGVLLNAQQATDLQAEIKFLRSYSQQTYDLARSEGQAVLDNANSALSITYGESLAQYNARVAEQKQSRKALIKYTTISAGAGLIVGGISLLLLLP